MDLHEKITDLEKRLREMDKEVNSNSSDIKVIAQKIDDLIERIDTYILHERNSMFVRKDECHRINQETEKFINRVIGGIILLSVLATLIAKFL